MKLEIQKIFRSLIVKKMRKRVKMPAPKTIFCNMCLGGVVSHDLGLRFDSPTVNLAIPANEFVSMVSDIHQINNEITLKGDRGYPIGLLSGRYTILFIHYKTLEEAVDYWRRRSQRVNYDNPYMILVETATCSYEDLERFDNLSYKNKIALVHKEYPQIKCAKVINGYDGQNKNGEILSYTSIFGKRMYDQVDWVSFLELDNNSDAL